MMTIHELDLLENAVDSLAEALSKFKEGDNGESKAYKFAVLHMAHFVELVFKHHIASKHPLLIFKEPFAAKLDRNRTITLWDAINFINNETPDAVSRTFKADLEWLKRLRNDIEHHTFTMEVSQVRDTIGKLFRSVREFVELDGEIDLEAAVPATSLEMLKVMSDEFAFKRANALSDARAFEIANQNHQRLPTRLVCEMCGEFTLVQNEHSSTGYRCLLCGGEDSNDIPATCDLCGVDTTSGELFRFPLDEETTEYRCLYCSGRHATNRDD